MNTRSVARRARVAIIVALGAATLCLGACSSCNKSKDKKGSAVGAASASGSGSSAPQTPVINREILLNWPATVARVSGKTKIAAKSACTIETRFASDGKSTLLSQIKVVCSGETIYRGGSGSGMRCRVNESPLGPKRFRYMLTCNDPGKRGGKAGAIAASLDTEHKRARVVRDGANAFRVVMTLQDAALERAGKPLSAGNEPSDKTFPTVTRKGKVAKVSGETKVKAGDACTVTLRATGRRGLACHISVRCAEAQLYGQSPAGFLRCTFKAGVAPTTLRDTVVSGLDADPTLELELAKNRVVVADGPPPASATAKIKAKAKAKANSAKATPTYRVEIALDASE